MIGRVSAFVSNAALAACIVSWSGTASAQWAVGADGDLTKQNGHAVYGGAFDARFGLRFGLPRAFIIHTLILQPELVVGYRWLPWRSEDVWRFGAGGRLGLLIRGIEPFFFGHVSGAVANGDGGYLGDFGAALDYRLPTWSFGYHYAREFIRVHGVEEPFDRFGMHAEVRGFWF